MHWTLPGYRLQASRNDQLTSFPHCQPRPALGTDFLLIADDGDDLKGGVNDVMQEKGDQEGHRLFRVEIGIGDDENQQQHDFDTKDDQEALGKLAQLQVAGLNKRTMKHRVDGIKNQGQECKKSIKMRRVNKLENSKTHCVNNQGQVDQMDQKGFQGFRHNHTHYSLVTSRMA